MSGHKIYIKRRRCRLEPTLAVHIRRCVKAVLQEEGITEPCEISVLITDDAEIKELNREYRNVNAPTDVLSFPMQELEPGKFDPSLIEPDPESSLLPLGDIIISLERAKAQAEEYGHSIGREVAYLTVHSMFHLLGYDHIDEINDKPVMRAKEEKVLSLLGLQRN